MKAKKIAGLVLALCMGVSLVGCGSSGDSDGAQDKAAPDTVSEGAEKAAGEAVSEESVEETTEGKEKDEIVISLGTQSCNGNFDPTQKWNRAYDFFHSCLMTFDNELNMVPDLATDYTISEDQLTYTFTLRDDVKFSDGTDMTTDDVIFTYEKAKESGLSIDLTKMEKVEALDEHTVQFTLSEKYSPFLANTTFLGIVKKDAWDESYGLHPVGTGKYKLVQLDQDQQMILEANEYYYGKQPSIRKITVLAQSDDVVYASLQAGTVDLTSIPANQAGMEIPGYHILSCDTNVTKFLHLPCVVEGTTEEGVPVGNNVTSDKAIREALNIGINRQEIVDDVLNGYGAPAYFLLENMPWSNEEPKFEDNRVEDAIQILEDAGWVDTDGDGIREKDGVKAEFTVNGSADETERYNIAVAVGQQAKALGINMNVVSTAWADCRAEALTTPTVWSVGNYQSIDVSNYGFSKLAGVSWYNPAFYQNEKVDEYIQQAFDADPEDANELWKKAQYDGTTGMNVDLAYLPIILANDVYYVRDGLDVGEQRIHDHGMGGCSIIYNLEDWSYDE